MITTTLTRIRAHNPCEDGWRKLLAGLGKTQADDEPLPYAVIVKINGLDDALWACRAEPQHAREWRLFAVWCAREALVYTNDWRATQAVQIAERYAHGMASPVQLELASDAARDAASDAAWAAAWDAASAAAWAAASAAARDAARDKQTVKFLEIVGEE